MRPARVPRRIASRAGDARGGGTGFRPDGGRPFLVAHGRQQLRLETVEDLARDMAEYRIAWLEEPFRPTITPLTCG